MRSLSNLCRSLRQPLEGGLSLLQAARLLAKNRRSAERRLGEHLAEAFQRGRSLSDALAAHRPALPVLFTSMLEVGEETGRLPETLSSLERFYALQEAMTRRLRGRMAVLLIQLGLAILVLALVIGVTTSISAQRGFSILGLRGWGGALAFIALAVGWLGFLYGMVRFVAWGLQASAGMARFALWLPGVGPFLEALALSRLALSLRLTLDSSLPIPRALKLSFQATANVAYVDQGEQAGAGVRRGEDLSVALSRVRVLPMMFLEVVAVGEAAGLVPERMGHLAEEYAEEAARRAQSLVRWASGALWLMYAASVIFAVFSLASHYIGALR